jgi:hypothetical protein
MGYGKDPQVKGLSAFFCLVHCGRKETRFARKINGTTILIDKVSKANTLTITIPRSTRKFHGTLVRHDEKDNKEKETYIW